MKTTLKTLVVAMGLGLAGQAGAAIVLPSTGNGELFLTAWDSVRQVSYSRQFDVNMNAFLPAGMTPETGLTVSYAGDGLFASTFTGSAAGDIQWNIVAADSNANPPDANNLAGVRILTTSTSSSGFSLTKTGVQTAVQSINSFATNVNAMGCETATSCATADPADFGYGGRPQWGPSFGNVGNVSNAGTGFGSLYFWYTDTPGSGFTQAAKTIYQNSLGAATWTLGSDGTATYSVPAPSAVPVPAAVWLFGSGLVGLVGIARRRKA